MKNNKILIESDVFDISKRIKKINKDYKIIYDTLKKKYFVSNKNGEIIYTLPFSSLDERVINYVVKMNRKSNLDIIEEMEMYNKKVFDLDKDKIKLSAINRAEKILRRS